MNGQGSCRECVYTTPGSPQVASPPYYIHSIRISTDVRPFDRPISNLRSEVLGWFQDSAAWSLATGRRLGRSWSRLRTSSGRPASRMCCMNSSFQWLKFLVTSRLTSKDRTFSFWKFDSIWMMYGTWYSMAISTDPLPTGQFIPRAIKKFSTYGTARPRYPFTSFSQASRRLCPSCLR